MVVGKSVVVVMEAVAAFHVASVCVESVFEAVELRLSVSTSSFQEFQSWLFSFKHHPNVCKIDCHVHDVSALACKSSTALTVTAREDQLTHAEACADASPRPYNFV